jgi:threonine/homoserine/homoserine lactone efflux protein
MTAWQAAGIGVGLGLGAGVTPGPLLALIISETLRGGWRAGMQVALAPPLADIVVVALCFLFLAGLPVSLLPMLNIGGGLYVVFLGWEAWHATGIHGAPAGRTIGAARQSLGKGIIVNLLNPHPYLFWLTVAGPLVVREYRQSAFLSITVFVGGFYGCLVGSKMLLALLVYNGRERLHGYGYRLILRASATLLLLLGSLLLWEGTRMIAGEG